jgi:hypothetical protein
MMTTSIVIKEFFEPLQRKLRFGIVTLLAGVATMPLGFRFLLAQTPPLLFLGSSLLSLGDSLDSHCSHGRGLLSGKVSGDTYYTPDGASLPDCKGMG